MVSLDRIGDQRDATSIGRPARHAEELGVERGDHLFDLAPGKARQVQHLHLVPRAQGLSRQREQTVRRLKKICVQITRAVVRRRTVPSRVGGLTRSWNFPGRGVDQSDTHERSSARDPHLHKFQARASAEESTLRSQT